MFQDRRKMFFPFLFASLALLLIALPAFAEVAGGGRTLPNDQILGLEDQSKQITVTFWLNRQNQAEFDELVRQMYDENSPKYHQWLTLKEYKAKFAPTAADAAVVRQYLAAHNLQVIKTDDFNHYVSARGTVADVQRATNVQINRVVINGEIHRAPSSKPVISGAAGKLVAAVQGLSDLKAHTNALRQLDPETGKPNPRVPLVSQPAGLKKYFNANCLSGTEVQTFKTNGGAPYAVYTGARYGDSITAPAPNLPPCGYDAPELQAAYGLNAVYKNKIRGQNQSIAIVDAYGSDTITTDANTFSTINGLPPLVSTNCSTQACNFAILYPTGPTNCSNNTCGWDGETSLDVEWSHAVAPAATIYLVLAADPSSTNLDLAVLFAIETGIAPVVSNSYGIGEIELITYDPGELTVENGIFQVAASLGVTVNFSSGDSGDEKGTYKVTTVSAEAASPYATGVGGTSLFLNANSTLKWQTGWGNNLTRIATYATGGPGTNPPLIPPTFEGFYAGAGGGVSGYYPNPSYQEKLGGTWRAVPDIAYLADPFTGVEIVDTEGGQQGIEVIGGTSLACPMFSGMWALATQAAGKWLGNAAPLLYGLPAGAITDVVAANGPDNVSGTTNSPPAPPVYYSPSELIAPVETTADFTSLLYQGTTTRWYAISFGTDSSLEAGPGWDNVTGLGTPNGLAFVTAVAGAK